MNKKTEKPNSSEKNKSFRSNKRLWQRILSFITVFALVINTMYSGGLFGLLGFPMSVRAEGEVSSYTPTNAESVFNNPSALSFADTEEGYIKFVDYCYYFSTDDSFAEDHDEDVLSIAFAVLPADKGFMGLGNATHPFSGRITFLASGGMANITLSRALFTHVSTDARITDNEATPNDITLEMTKNSSTSSPLLADYVHAGAGAANWKINVASGNTNSFAGVIGEIEANTSVNLTFNNQSSATVSNTASGENDIKDVGELCGIMKTGSSLNVTDNTTTRPAVSSTNGNAGSLVGTMEGTASLTLSSYPGFSNVSVTSDNGYAGGLVGKTSTEATISGLSSLESIGGTVTGKTGAGGLYGHYTNSASSFDIKDYNITATVSADNCGGVFGVLESNKGEAENALSLTIKNTSNAGTVNVRSGSTASTGAFGGLVGKYSTDNIANSLILDNLTVTANARASFGSFGGTIGYVDGPAYIKADDMSIIATGTARGDNEGYFGGLVGKTSDTRGVFLDLGDITLTVNDSGGFTGGGIVGDFKNGVLRLSGVTDMSGAQSKKGGQLVGKNDNVLVYAIGDGTDGVSSVRGEGNAITTEATGWSFKRSSTASSVDDLGTWGEVVRIADIEDSTNGVLTLDSTNHTVTVKAALTSIGTQTDFVKTALNIQLNQGDDYDCLKFTSGNNTRTYLLGTTLALSDDLSLANTGITGFMRDGSDSVGVFSGTLNGNSHTITLATGQAYGLTGSGSAVSSSSEGVGQIYTHKLNGLFSILGNTTSNSSATVSSLKVAGTIDVRNKVDGMNIGGVAAKNGGSVTLSGVTVGDSTGTMTINYNEITNVGSSGDTGKNIGGLIGFVGENGTIDIQGLTSVGATVNISGYHTNYNYFGGAIGNITAETFTVNAGTENQSANKLAIKANVSVSGVTDVGADSNSGGLIGRIKDTGSFSTRTVNVNNVDFNGCTLANASSEKGGGVLGYSWLNTTANIKGLNVTSATINNCTTNGAEGGNTDIGAMCYVATGKWIVDSLAVSSLSMPKGAGTSLGMIVNKMYTTNTSGNVNGALYLDVLNAGYTLDGSSITLPDSIGLYDEIAVYSAPNVVTGGAGVISINSARDTGSASITTTGTYQNKLSRASGEGTDAIDATKFANANSRYYYNLDRMSTSDAGQNLVLWSVGKYIYSNIKSAITATTLKDSNLKGTASLAGLSYYPVAKAGDYTLNGLNVTFDYNGIFATAEDTFPTGLTTDGYKRDPGATGTNKNQHYLMHGGLFIDLPAGKTITVSGSSSLGGTFLEVDGYQAALISGTMNGNLNISGSLNLNGLIPKKTGNALHDDGYLLINSISRPDSQTQTVSVNISGLTASDYSSATLPVARSLIGTADGRGFMFDLSGIKLDGRQADVSDSTTNSALNTAYGTTRSIFSDAILFYSINTDRNAEMTYNFTYDDDWGTGTGSTAKRNVTYGNEISHTVEYWDSEGNKSRQSKYSGTPKNYTNPTGANTEYDFLTTVFLPYVGEPYDTTADHSVKYYRELKVNYLLEIESKGCGTYNDPYIIETPEQLTAIAAFIKSGNTTSINLNSITLPKYDATKHHGVELNSTGNRWCTDKEGNDYHVEYSAKTGGGFEATGCTDWPDADARYYLASAYYKIEKNINLGSDFDGLGGTEANYAFRGVIVGETDDQGAPKYSITNKSNNPFIYVSNGCVVKDVSVIVNYASGIQIQQDNNSSTNAYFGYNYASADTCNFYGGIIGEIMGGDNIIDNSYVTFSNTSITLKGESATIVPVGGYVGVVIYGGLIFKNMTAAKTTIAQTGLSVSVTGESYNLADNSEEEAWAAIYVNPIVGRVINGYAVNETGGNAKNADGTSVKQYSTSEDGKYHDDGKNNRSGAVEHTLKNGKKHYSIADIDPDTNDYAQLDVTSIPTSASANGNIDVPNAQALFVLSLITQSGAGTATDKALGAYPTDTPSLSYGIYSGNVYGMSHNANYSDVGTDDSLVNDDPNTEEDETNITDYQKLASFDTTKNENNSAPIPYVVKHYTVGGTTSGYTTRTDTHYSATRYTGTTVPAGPVIIGETRNNQEYLTNERADGFNKRQYVLYSTFKNHNTEEQGLTLEETKIKNAIEVYFEKNPLNSTYRIFYTYEADNGDEGRKYLRITNADNQGRGNLFFDDTGTYFDVTYKGDNKWWITYDNKTITFAGDKTNYCSWSTTDAGSNLAIYERTVTTTLVPIGYTTTHNYPARCVTSSAGYFDITLTGSGTYQLPDSFRGLGCVGNNNAAYNFKVDSFNGNGLTIDEDIYLNKFKSDNYFNVIHSVTTQATNSGKPFDVNKDADYEHHGIGFFDSLVTSGSNSKLTNFTLKGSVNTEMYDNTYNVSSQEITVYASTDARFMAVGGVCGSTNGTATYLTFDQINLNPLSISGSCTIGGLLGYSNNQNPANINPPVSVTVNKCSATDLTIKLNSTSALSSAEQARNAMGGFVGKCVEGKVIITGDTTSRSSVTIKAFGYETLAGVSDHRAVAGGLVGFAGNGCTVSDMNLSPTSGYTVEIGSDYTAYAGGLVGLMQPSTSGGTSCVAEFTNCKVERINVNGHYAGGFYGGKWFGNNNTYVPYQITLDNCEMAGDTSANSTITGNHMRNAHGYAGGFLGCGNVYTNGSPNITIKDCKVSHYTIASTAEQVSKNGYVGGFIGYTGSSVDHSSITCYIHDSSVENCIIGTGNNYAGGAIGQVYRRSTDSTNKILGYNIKLDNVTLGGKYNGAWIGQLGETKANITTSIQFTGLGIYGKNYKRNIGSWSDADNQSNTNASFVFADYEGACIGTIPEGETEREYPTDISTFNNDNNVTMPKYPYVNINPQSSMGTGEYISGDGAVLFGSAVSGFTGTGSKTMAAKIYSERNNSGATKQYYSTYVDTAINNGSTINAYMNRSVDADGDRISNYYAEKGYDTPQAYDNFACIVIANNTTPETTDLINRYAQLVTNTTTDYAGTDASNTYFDIVVSPCILRDGAFVIDTSESAEAGLTYSNGSFALNPSGADTMKSGDTFTLVDIQFKDPLDTTKVAYHLYIPVYTIKEIEVTFKAGVMNGTNSVSYDNTGAESVNPYSDKLELTGANTHVDNLNTWYTTYIRYTYEHEDIEMLLNSGNLNWNHDKFFYIDKTNHTATSMLPADTYMILVDPNGDHDKKYQVLLNTSDFARQNVTSTTGRITFDLAKFADGNNHFSVCTFNELIAQKLTAEENDGHNGRYNLCSETPENPNTGVTQYVYIKDATGEATYYEYVGSGGAYDITLADGDVYENYYISMYVPGVANDTSLYGYNIRTPESFEAPSYASGTNNAVTKSAKVTCHFGDNTTTQNRQVYIGNLFTQETELTVLPNDTEIDNGNHTLNIYARTTIKPKDGNVTTILNASNADIYHAFNVYLDRKGENGAITNTIYGLANDGSKIKAWYSVGTEIPTGDEANMEVAGINEIDVTKIDLQSSYINIATVDGGQTVLNSSGVTIYSRIRLDFGDYASEFPQKVSSDTGVSVRAASNLAYDTTSLAFSSMSASLEEPTATKHIYYRQSLDNAKLYYYAETDLDSYDTDGAPSENYSRLGVSGKYSMNEYMPIDSTARYNVQNIENAWGDADNLVLTLSLQKKTDLPVGETYTSASYQDVSNINAYWGAVQRDVNNEVAPNAAGKPVTNSGTTNLRITCGSYDQIVPVSANQNTFTWTIPKEAVETSGFTIDENGYIYIGVGFNAKTGDGFTEYANYKVNLSVKLLDGDSDVTGSYADDYLIYTNAKVNHDFLKDH